MNYVPIISPLGSFLTWRLLDKNHHGLTHDLADIIDWIMPLDWAYSVVDGLLNDTSIIVYAVIVALILMPFDLIFMRN